MNDISQDDVRNSPPPRESRRKGFLFSAGSFTERKKLWLPGLLFLLFLGVLFWAKAKDPYKRIEFTLRPENGPKAKALVVLPKPFRPVPVVIFAHDRNETHLSSGSELRQMAEMGMAAIGFEYDQNSRENFNAQLRQIHREIRKQSWALTNQVAWVGAGLGAEWMLQFALENPELQPQAMFQLAPKWLPDLERFEAPSQSIPLKSRIGLYYPESTNVVSLDDSRRLRDFLATKGAAVDLRIVATQQHNFEPDRSLIFRVLGEHCLQVFGGEKGLQTYRSISLWDKNSKPLVLFLIPAFVWIAFWIYVKRQSRVHAWNVPLARWERGLRALAIFLVILASAQSAIHLLTPRFKVTNWTLSIAENFLINSKWREDFDAVKRQPVWSHEPLKSLLSHVELSNYNRELINWRVDDSIYREFVLSPIITGDDKELNWRRPLWEDFYPRIRKENSAFTAAVIIVRHLRERVTISNLPFDQGIEEIWLQQITDKDGFEAIYVAAMRSAGIAARLNSEGRAEFWDDLSWQLAPRPVIEQLDKL